jgi:hypothetical protein
MDTAARLVLDEAFERAVARVVDGLVKESFAVRALDRGDLHRPAIQGGALRYALLEAALPDLPVGRASSGSTRPANSWCRLCLVEVNGSCTLVTVERPRSSYPLLASPARVAGRVANALRLAARHGSALVAA